MKKSLLLALPILMVSSIISVLSPQFQTQHAKQQRLKTEKPVATFNEKAIITSESNGVEIEDWLNVYISKNRVNELNNNPDEIETFLNNLTYDKSQGTAFTRNGYLPQLKIYLGDAITQQLSTLVNNCNDVGVVINFYTYFNIYDQSMSAQTIDINPYIEYTPATATGNFDEIEKYYKFLAHDILKVDISQEGWNWIKINGNNNLILRALFDQFPKYDKSGAGGSITDGDIELLATIVIKNWSVIENYFNQSQTKGVKITTNTEGDDVKIGYE